MSITNSYVLPHLQVLVPEIGKGKEANMQKTIDSMKDVASRIASEEPETLVIITGHGDAFENYFHLNSGSGAVATLSDFGVSGLNIKMNYDEELIQAIAEECKANDLEGGLEGEDYDMVDHGTAVPLYYIDPVMKKDYKVVRIFVSGQSLIKHYQYGKAITTAINKLGRKVTIVASGDSSHRLKEDGPLGFNKEASTFESAYANLLESGNFLGLFAFEYDMVENAVECSLRPLSILAGALDGKMVKGDLISYEDTYGVGCAVCAYDILDAASDEKLEMRQFDVLLANQIKEILAKNDDPSKPYIYLAKQAIENYVLYKKVISPSDYDLPEEMLNTSGGVFVTINIGNRTRGCVGSITAVKDNLAEEIINAAIDTCYNDPRFIPVEIEELDALSYQIDVIKNFQPIKALSKINPKKEGLCITFGQKTGIVLPGIKGVNAPTEQLKMAQERSGIKPGDKYNMWKFEVDRYE